LYKTCCFGEIQTRVTNLGKKDGVDLGIVLEVFQNAHTLILWGTAVNVSFVQLERIFLQSKNIIRKNDDLVASLLVIVNEELAGLEFVRIERGYDVVLW